MADKVFVWCGPDKLKREIGQGKAICLSSFPPNPNVHLKVEKICEKLARELPSLIYDLLEIASYVYAADQTTSRGGEALSKDGRSWRRSFRFSIPVRKPEIWQRPSVTSTLVEVLSFLSEDHFEFDFRKLSDQVPLNAYFDFDMGKPWFDANRVMLFSGGLDSLAGLTESILHSGENVLAVSHRAAPQVWKLQRELLRDFVRETDCEKRFLHVPVWVYKKESLTNDNSQRTRSFLYASLAAALSLMHGLHEFHFYENGITSANLPMATQVIGSRASRTTHPKVLHGFGLFFSELFGEEFQVSNPFFWKTKSEVVDVIRDAGLSKLIGFSSSCSHVRSGDPINTHCGVCFQCLNRRLAALYAGVGEDDPNDMYKVKLPLDSLDRQTARAMVELHIRQAREYTEINDRDFFAKYGESHRIIPFLKLNTSEAAEQLYSLHQRYGYQVCDTLAAFVKENANLIAQRGVPRNSTLALIVAEESRSKSGVPSGTSLDLPLNISWQDLLIEVVADDSIRVKIGRNFSKILTYAEIGFKDNRKGNLPNSLWLLLLVLAENNGTLNWQSHGVKQGMYKPIQRLKERLQSVFGLDGDPIQSYQKNNAYITSFKITDRRFGRS
jgi:7-cyano-7-deazaguanine synthase in queuosine biosynthesis